MHNKNQINIKMMCRIIVFLLIIIINIRNVRMGGGGGCPDCYYFAVVEDAKIYLYSTMNFSLRKNDITIDNPPLDSEIRYYNVEDIVDAQLIEGLFVYMNSKINNYNFIKRLEHNDGNISIEINSNDSGIKEIKIIYNGLYFLTIMKTSIMNLDLSCEGREYFYTNFYVKETSTIIELVGKYISQVRDYDEKELSYHLYEYNETKSDHFILGEKRKENTEILFDDKNFNSYKELELSDILRDNGIEEYFAIGNYFYINHMVFNIFPGEYSDSEIGENFYDFAEYRQVENILMIIENEMNQMEKDNFRFSSNLNEYNDFYEIYTNNKIKIRKSIKFLISTNNILSKYDKIANLDFCEIRYCGGLLPICYSINLKEEIPIILKRLEIIEKDLELLKGIKETKDQMKANQVMIYLTYSILIFTLILGALNFFWTRKSDTRYKRSEESNRNQEILLKKITEELKKNNEVNVRNKSEFPKKGLKKMQMKKNTRANKLE